MEPDQSDRLQYPEAEAAKSLGLDEATTNASPRISGPECVPLISEFRQ
jgi:hypothetical protein